MIPVMFSIAVCWLYTTLLTSFFGWVALVGPRSDSAEPAAAVPWSLLPLVGLAVVSVLTGYLSLLMPIDGSAHGILLLLAAGLGWVFRRRLPVLATVKASLHSGGWPEWIALALLLLLLLLKSAVPVDRYGPLAWMFHSDTAYYHAPSIRWIEEVGLVPGLGNLLPPLAVDYLWFQPCALFGFSFLLPHRLHALTGFAVFWAFCFALGGLRELLQGRQSFSNGFRGLLLLPLLELGNYIVSDSGDEPAAIVALVTLALSCRYAEQQADAPAARSLGSAVVILALFAVALKWSMLPLLLLVAAIALQEVRWSGPRGLIPLAVVSTVMLLPKLLRSVLLSGYLIYPFPAVDLFDVDWKMPREVVTAEKMYMESMARIRFDRPGQLLEGGFDSWFRDWVPKFFAAPVGTAVTISLVVLLGTILLRRGAVATALANYRSVYFSVWAGLVYWFVTAPHVRFAYGFLSGAAILSLLPALRFRAAAAFVNEPWVRRYGSAVTAGSLAVLVLFTCPRPAPGDALGSGIAFSDFYARRIDSIRRGKAPRDALIYQTPYPDVELKRFDLGGLAIYRPLVGQHCWDAPLPCTPYLYRRIEARGPRLEDGYRAVPGPVEAFDGQRLAEEWRRGLRSTSRI